MKRCPICKRADLRQVEEKRTIAVPLRSGPIAIIVTGLPGTRCPGCSEGFFEGAEMERADLLAAAEVADRGLREGAALRFMRRSLGLRADELASLLDVPGSTLSRWENDQAPVERAAWAAVGAMISEQLTSQTTTIDRLRAARDPREPHGPVYLRIAHEMT